MSRRKFEILVLILVAATSLLTLSGCGADEPKGVAGDATQNRADMIKWHQEHDKKPATQAGN
jgi:hypothetical protein